MHEGGEDLQPVSQEDVSLEDAGYEADTEQTDEGPANETARETVERVLRETETEAEGAESGEKQENLSNLEKPVRKAKKEQAQAKPQPFNIPAPNRLSAEQKELFHKLPDDLKRATHAMFKAQEEHFTQVVQRATAREKESQHILEAVRPYYVSHPELAQAGYTESSIVTALIGAHQKLTDPKTARQAYAELGKEIGIDDNILEAIAGQQTSQPQDISAHPQFQALSEQLNQLKSHIDGTKQQQFQSQVQGIVGEMEAVRNEMTADGRFVYPKLHDQAFLEQAKPLVSAFVRALPGLSYGEALKKAYAQLDPTHGNSYQRNQARFPAQTNNTLERAQRAVGSVRGRSAPSSPGGTGDVPQEALGSARDTVRWALNQMRRGA